MTFGKLLKNSINKLQKECLSSVKNKLFTKHLELLLVNSKSECQPLGKYNVSFDDFREILSQGPMERRELTHQDLGPHLTMEHQKVRACFDWSRSQRKSSAEAPWPHRSCPIFLAWAVLSTYTRYTKKMQPSLFPDFYAKFTHSERFIKCLLVRDTNKYPYYSISVSSVYFIYDSSGYVCYRNISLLYS